jgi:hypothetical protein
VEDGVRRHQIPRHRRIRRVDEFDKTPHELLIAGDGIHATRLLIGCTVVNWTL